MADLQVTKGGSEVRILTVVDAITLSNLFGSPSQDPQNPTLVGPEAAGRALYSIASRAGEIEGVPNPQDQSIALVAGAGDVLVWRMTTLSLNQDITVEMDVLALSNESLAFDSPRRKDPGVANDWLVPLPFRSVSVTSIFQIRQDGDLFGFFLWKPSLSLLPPGRPVDRDLSSTRAGSAAA